MRRAVPFRALPSRSMRPARRLLLPAALLVLAAPRLAQGQPALAQGQPALAQGQPAEIGGVEVRTQRSFGYFLGDLVQATVEIAAGDGFAIHPASLPKPGPVTYWLDLRAVEARTEGGRHRLRLTYQNFYAALDARDLEVPGFSLTLASEADGSITTTGVQVPAWRFGVSPLRAVQPPAQADPADHLRPDGVAPRLAVGPLRNAALALLGLALSSLLLLARDRAWWPFRPRRARAFAAALHHLRRLVRQGSETDDSYRDGLLALHRGLDLNDGRRVLADDLSGFLTRHPAYRPHAPDLARFFEASRLAFFGEATATARARLPLREAQTVASALAATEREAA